MEAHFFYLLRLIEPQILCVYFTISQEIIISLETVLLPEVCGPTVIYNNPNTSYQLENTQQ